MKNEYLTSEIQCTNTHTQGRRNREKITKNCNENRFYGVMNLIRFFFGLVQIVRMTEEDKREVQRS